MEKMLNSDGAVSPMRDLEDLRYPDRGSSPLRLWQVGGVELRMTA